MFGEEAGEAVSVVWPVLLGLAQPVNQDDGEAAGDLPLVVEEAERQEHSSVESSCWVCVTVGDVDVISGLLV